MKYEKGDRIVCNIKGSEIVSRLDKKIDIKLEFEIIGYDAPNYVIHIPPYYNITNRFHINETQLQMYGINRSYLNNVGYTISNKQIIKIFKKSAGQDGMFCKRCKLWFGMAEANQPDGTLICYSCRENPYR